MGKNSKDKRDIYYRAAKELGYRARSAFKLQQLDKHYQLLHGQRQPYYCTVHRRESGSSCDSDTRVSRLLPLTTCPPSGLRVQKLAVDLAAMAPMAPNVHCVQGDLTHPSTVRAILDLLHTHRSSSPTEQPLADCVLCDCAPDVVHQADVDEMVQHDLVKAALRVAEQTLRADGSFVCKVFRGPHLPALLRRCAQLFGSVEVAKPTASRNSSLEAFIVARRYATARDTGAEEERGGYDSGGDSDEEGCEQLAVPFVSCGDDMGLDSDQTYPLSFRIPNTQHTAYQPLAPAAAPIAPPYEQSINRRRDRANGSHNQTNS